MESVAFPDSCGFRPRAFDSEHEFSDYEGSSHDEGTVSTAVWTPEFLTGNSHEGVLEGDVADTLFRRGSSQPTADRRRASTSLFSDRTRHRWVLGDRWVVGEEEEVAPGGGATPVPAAAAQRRGRREGLQSGRPRRHSTAHGLRSGIDAAGTSPYLQRREGHRGHSRGAGMPSAGGASIPTAAAPLRRPRGRQQPAVPKTRNWTNGQLQAALIAHERGCSVSGATALYNIPRTSFRAHLAGIVLSRKRSAATVLSKVEEEQLVQYVIAIQDLGFPLTILQLKLKVAMMTQGRETPFTNGVPGTGWVRWFKRRHPELSVRLAQGLNAKRARSLCAINVSSFYENLSSLYATYQYLPSQFGIATRVESKQGAMEGLTCWPKLGLVICTRSFQTNANG
jgi:hypothetical protein